MAKSLKIELPDHVHEDLVERAQKAQQPPEEHAVALITKALREIDGEPQQSVADLRHQLTDAIVKAGNRLVRR